MNLNYVVYFKNIFVVIYAMEKNTMQIQSQINFIPKTMSINIIWNNGTKF